MGRVKRLFFSERPCHRSQGNLGARLDQAVKPQLLACWETTPEREGNEHSGTEGATNGLMEQVCERQNCLAALKRVRENKGSPGIDGMTVRELPAFLKLHWPRIREELLAGRYQPQPVSRVSIRNSAEASASSAFRPCSTGSSSRPFCRSCNRGSIRPSRRRATAFGRAGGRTMPYAALRPICRMAAASSWILIWRSSSIV